ncbi:biosynthetic peptidoglycan transglycosylase [Halomonas sp. 1390]|uniref:biosynthetic peptidoglycan transglycosylase n=1 Tax=Halomonas sp. B23F22_3 TaxID=3459516 RepID=UPI00373FBCC0
MIHPKKTITIDLNGRPASKLDLKGWLIHFNLALDIIIHDMKSKKFSTSLELADETTNFERHVLALEDRKFYKHNGIDYISLLRIGKQFLKRKRLGGVSTIEQQYVRTVLNRRERTLERKSHEIILSWLLSKRSTKNDILRAYLGSAYFGYNLNNCDVAAKLLFNVDAASCNNSQSALIASLLVYPLPKKVIKNSHANHYFPIDDVDEFIAQQAKHAPHWSRRVLLRKAYSESLIKDQKA